MFKIETQSLITLANDDKFKPLKKKIQTIGNLANTMDQFIVNLLEEINESRT